MGSPFQVLTVDEFVALNRRLMEVSGGGMFLEGDRNMAQPGSLDYAMEAVNAELFGEELHPSVVEKAAVIAWHIIKGHIFHDGNKRTGMAACVLLLQLNGYDMPLSVSDLDVALAVAEGTMSRDMFIAWVEQRAVAVDLDKRVNQ